MACQNKDRKVDSRGCLSKENISCKQSKRVLLRSRFKNSNYLLELGSINLYATFNFKFTGAFSVLVKALLILALN